MSKMLFTTASIVFSVLLAILPVANAAPSATDAFNDGIDRTDPNFVTASLLVMSPGDELYTCAGHAALRLECPTFKLDNCFTYEGETVKDRIFRFFRGNLKMGMFVIPTTDYLKMTKENGYGIVQYKLNLPPDVKQRLWRILDGIVIQGVDRSYDYIKGGCAKIVLEILCQAVTPIPIKIPQWSDQYRQSRREFLDVAVAWHPWNRFFLHAICGTETDWDVPNFQKVVIPSDLLAFLKTAKVNGTPLIIDSEGVELLPVKLEAKPSFFSPLVVTCAVVALSAANWFLNFKWLDWLLLVFQSLAGAFFTYLVAFSNLPATSWNWLIVPFNLLPLVFWKWRKKWALWFAGVLVLWEVGMIAYPHRLTDPAYLVLVGAYVLMYARIGWPGRACRPATAAPGGRVSSRAATEGGRLK